MKFLFPAILIILSLHLSAVLGYSQTRNSNAAVSTINDELSQPTAKTRVARKVKIPMRDGARLVADIVFPEPAGKLSAASFSPLAVTRSSFKPPAGARTAKASGSLG